VPDLVEANGDIVDTPDEYDCEGRVAGLSEAGLLALLLSA
jgi:hypothetical protein